MDRVDIKNSEVGEKRDPIQDKVKIVLEKKEGEAEFNRSISASSLPAALMGLEILIMEIALLTQIPVGQLFSRMAADILTPISGGEIPQ